MGLTGRILNLLSSDPQRFLETAPLFNQVFAAPLIIGAACYFLFKLVGTLPAIIAVSGLLALPPANFLIAGILLKIRKQRVTMMDKRTRLCNEVLLNIRIIKYFSWEKPYLEKILELRQEECRFARKELLCFATSMILKWLGPTVAMSGALIVYSILSEDGSLTPARAFSVLTFSKIMRYPLQ